MMKMYFGLILFAAMMASAFGVCDFDSRLSAIEKQLSQRSAFSATLKGTNHYQARYTQIKFPTVRYNLGKNYDARASVYKCPYDGVYLFQLSIITTSGGTKLGAGIMKSGRSLAWTFEEGRYHTGSVTALTDCRAGEKVWVKSWAQATRVHGDTWPVFSGAYLYPSK